MKGKYHFRVKSKRALFESWEQFFTDLLITLTKDTTGKYAKETLNKFYLQEKNMQKIIEQFPDMIKNSILTE